MNLSKPDAEYLLGRPEFRRFMFAAIQSAGLFTDISPSNGQSVRDHQEGRRSLGWEMVRALDAGQPEPLRTSEALATIQQIILQAMNPAPDKEKPRGSRYDDITDRDDRGDGSAA